MGAPSSCSGSPRRFFRAMTPLPFFVASISGWARLLRESARRQELGRESRCAPHSSRVRALCVQAKSASIRLSVHGDRNPRFSPYGLSGLSMKETSGPRAEQNTKTIAVDCHPWLADATVRVKHECLTAGPSQHDGFRIRPPRHSAWYLGTRIRQSLHGHIVGAHPQPAPGFPRLGARGQHDVSRPDAKARPRAWRTPPESASVGYPLGW